MRITRTELRGLRGSQKARQGVQAPPGAPKPPLGQVIPLRRPPGPVVTVWVPGRPVPQSRPRLGRSWRGRSQVHELERVTAWKAALAWCVKAAGVQVVTGPVRVELAFVLEPGQRGDLDNFVKAALDALRGVAYVDDDQVVALDARKLTTDDGAQAGVLVSIDATV